MERGPECSATTFRNAVRPLKKKVPMFSEEPGAGKCRSSAVGTAGRSSRGTAGRLRAACAGPVLVALLWVLGTIPAAWATSYVYDANGRLAAVTAPNGATVQYQYDALGNILGIQSVATGQLALFSFSPSQGAPGAQVTLSGDGFSTTPSSDTVAFNGVSATLVSATATQIVATVPPSATTGPVTVTVGTTTVTSSADFVVVGAPPVITGFAPAYGDPGSSVTVSGSSLDPIPGATTAALGSAAVSITAVSDSALTFTVPVDAVSGAIGVTTPDGSAATASDFVVIPSAIGAANIQASASLVPNGAAQALSVSSANQYGVFTFNALAGQWLSVQLSALTTTPAGSTVPYTVYSPANVVIASGSVSATNLSIHLPALTLSGAYLIAFDSGAGPLQLSATLQSDTILAPTETPTTVAITVSGQSQRLAFTLTAGQTLALTVGSISTVPADTSVPIVIYGPNGSILAYTTVNTSSGYTIFNLPNLAAGTYTVSVVPNNAATATMQFTLFPGVTGTLSPTATTSAAFSTLAPNQNAYLTFSGTAGENLGLALTNLTLSSTAATGANVYIYNPDGSEVNYMPCNVGTSCGVSLTNLPQTGTYQVVVVPNGPATMSFDLTLSPDVTGTITATPLTLNLAEAGQIGLLNFTATAGQTLALTVNSVTTVPANTNVLVEINGPGSSYLTYAYTTVNSSTNYTFNLTNLAAGTYTVSVVPNNAATATMQLGLSG